MFSMIHLLNFMLGVFFARLIHSTSQFAMTVLGKCVCVCMCVGTICKIICKTSFVLQGAWQLFL